MSEKDSFYVSLPSTRSRGEFPTNKANDFKVRLPHPLRLRTGEWEVGLATASLPDAAVVLPDFADPPDEHLFSMTWKAFDTSGVERSFSAHYDKSDMTFLTTSGITGITFMQSVVNFFHNKRVGFKSSETYKGYKFYDDNVNLDRTYYHFKWECNCTELVTDNADTTQRRHPTFKINTFLAKKMGWIARHPQGYDILGPNIRMEHFRDLVPNPSDAHADVHDGVTSKFWEYSGNMTMFSNQCNWRFLNLNSAFFNLLSFPAKSLFVYSDVSVSSVVGNQITDLLREVHFKREGKGITYFEPIHVQYKDLRNTEVDVIHIQVAEDTGALYPFDTGTTAITLHFRKKGQK